MKKSKTSLISAAAMIMFLIIGLHNSFSCTVNSECDDSSVCTTDSCQNGSCVLYHINCDDGEACTSDSCNASTGCFNTPLVCNDNNACTLDSCYMFAGCYYAAINCDDQDACTLDSCDTGTGCFYTTVVCNDIDACTLDSCDFLNGCFYTAIAADFSYYVTCYQNQSFVVDFTDQSDCSYQWSWGFGNGSTSTVQNPSVSYLSPGVYTVTLTINGSGTPATTTQQITIDTVAIPVISGPTQACSSDSQAYVITNYSSQNDYLWFAFGGSWNDPATDSLEYITWSDGFGGTITIFAENDLGCFTEGALEVDDCPCDISVTSEITGINCLNPTGCIALTVTGGAPPYTYSWSKMSGFFSSTSEDICNLSEGKYNVTITDAFECSVAYGPLSVIRDSFTITYMKTDASCGSANGSIDLTVTPPGNYTFNWMPYPWMTEDVSGLSPGPYMVTVTDSTPCSRSATITINSNSTLQGSLTHTDATCGNCDGTITGNFTSGYPPLIYHWTGNLVTNTPYINGLCPGNYTVTATDMMGCSLTQGTIIGETCDTVTCDPMNLVFTTDNTLYCLDDTIHYTITSSVRPIIGFLMDELTNVYPVVSLNSPFRGSITVAEGIQDHIFTPGLHQFCFVQLPVFQHNHCPSDTSCVQFLVDSCFNPCDEFGLHASFTWAKDVNSSASPHTYLFTNTSTSNTNPQFSFIEWDFGDGTDTTLAPPQSLSAPISHTFSGPPPYNVCLSVAYNDPVTYYCCKDEHCVQIQPGACDTVSLVVVINSTVDNGDSNTMHFNAVAPSASTYPVQQYLWNFGDGKGASGDSVKHTYAHPGYYNVCVTVLYHFSDDPDICCPASDCDQVCIGDPQQHQQQQVQMICVNKKPEAGDGKDAMILSSSIDLDMAKTNFSNYECLMAHSMSTGLIFRSLVDFDLPSIEPDSKVENAKLTLYNSMCAQHDHSGSGTVLIRRITSPWDEDNVNWENQPSATKTNQVSLSTELLNNKEETEVDVSLLVRDMLKDRERSYGFMLMLEDENNYSGISFGSSDNFDGGKHPMLDVCYQKEASTGITAPSQAGNIIVYPNPSEGLFNVDLTAITGNERLMQILDINGKIVLERKGCNDSEQLNLSKVNNGIYIIKVTSEGKGYIKKVVKM